MYKFSLKRKMQKKRRVSNRITVTKSKQIYKNHAYITKNRKLFSAIEKHSNPSFKQLIRCLVID